MTFEEWREKRGYEEPIRGGEEWHARDAEIAELHAQVEAARRAVTAWRTRAMHEPFLYPAMEELERVLGEGKNDVGACY